MMIKVFSKDKEGKISFTEEELKKLLDEAYWEGYNSNHSYVYHSPLITTPYWPVVTNAIDKDSITLSIGNVQT